jgi:hypothetical protein
MDSAKLLSDLSDELTNLDLTDQRGIIAIKPKVHEGYILEPCEGIELDLRTCPKYFALNSVVTISLADDLSENGMIIQGPHTFLCTQAPIIRLMNSSDKNYFIPPNFPYATVMGTPRKN